MELLDGTNANIDFEIDYQSYKCQASSMGVDFVRRAIPRPPTFCSNNWENAINGMKSINWVMTGFLATGDAASSFGQYHLEDTYPQITATFEDNCTVDFTSVVEHDTGGTKAADLSTRVISGRNHNDDVAVAWVDS